MHLLENELKLLEPAGFTGVSRSGIFLSSITANPPSVVLSCAWSTDVAANVAVAVSIARSDASGLPSVLGAGAGCDFGASAKWIASFLHLPRQFIQDTQRV